MSNQNESYRLELETIETVIKGLKKQIDVLEERKKIIFSENNVIHRCELCDLTFDSYEKLQKHLNSRKHLEKTGIQYVKCSLCNNYFTKVDLLAHTEDGRCVKSRTCKKTGIVYANMMSKSRNQPKKKPKLKLKVINNSVIKKDIPKKEIKKEIKKEEPKKEIKEEPKIEIKKEKPMKKYNKDSLFEYDKPSYTIQPLKDFEYDIDDSWYEDLHEGITENNQYYHQMTTNMMYLANCEGGLYLKKNIIYDKSDDDKLFEIVNIDNVFYDLIDIYKKKEEETEEPLNELLPLSTIKEEDNFNENTYVKLHEHIKHNITGAFAEKFDENIIDINDDKYQDGYYMYYHDGFLWRNNEKLYRFFKHHSGLFYDIEPCDEIMSVVSSDSSVKSV